MIFRSAITGCQYGFLPRRSSLSNFLILEKNGPSVDRKPADVVFLKFAKAFYSTYHGFLIAEFELFGRHGAFRHFKIRGIVQESAIYHRVEGSLLCQNPLSVKSAKFSFSRYAT